MIDDPPRRTSPTRMCHIVMNATAGSAHRERLALALREGIPHWPITLHEPDSPQKMLSLIRQIPSHEDLVIAGGDGTLQCALLALIETKHPVVVLPLGTANDFATHWGYTADVVSLQKCLSERVLRKVDVIECNDVHFLTVGGLGVGALLTRDFNWIRKLSPITKRIIEAAGSNIYTFLAATTILGRRSYLRHLSIESEQSVISGLFSNVFVCNQAKLGGNLLVAPQAKTNDGEFDVLFLRAETPDELLYSLACLRMNREPLLSERLRTREMVIRATDGREQLVFVDGEAVEMESTLHFKIHSSALTLLTAGGEAA